MCYFLAGINSRDLLCFKTFEINLSFLVFTAVWHFLLSLNSLSSLRCLSPDKSDSSWFSRVSVQQAEWLRWGKLG